MSTKKEEQKPAEGYSQAYKFSSMVWGQSIIVEEAVSGLVPICVADFDSGQCVKIAIEVPLFNQLCDLGKSLVTMAKMKGTDKIPDVE